MAAAAAPAPLLVRVWPAPGPQLAEKLPLKLGAYFQSPRRSGGGECEVQPGPEPGTYLVRFVLEKAKNSVKSREHHALEIDGKNLKILIQADSEVEDPRESQPTTQSLGLTSTSQLQKKSDKKQLGEKHDASSSSGAFTEKIFLHVSATLNTNLFTKQQRQQVIVLCPQLKIEQKSSDHGIEKVKGDYEDIEKVYHYFDDLLIKNDQHTDFSYSERKNELKEMTRNGLEEVNNIEVPSALYEYFNHVFEEQIKKLQERFKVKIKSKENDHGLTSVCFISVEKSGLADKARQSFINDFQKGIADLKQEKVTLSNRSQLNETLQKLNTKFRRLLAKNEGNTVILRGPANEILAAKKFLEEENTNSPVENPVKITSEAYSFRNGIEVDSVRLRLLETIFNKEIEAINQKFDTIMETKGYPQSQTVFVIFKPKTKNLDMSAHAYESFITAFQKAAAINEEEKKQLTKSFNNLQQENAGITIQEKEKKLNLQSLPDVHADGKHMGRSLNFESPASFKEERALTYGGSYASASGTSWNSDDKKMNRVPLKEQSRPQIAGGEEAKDQCAICMDKIHQKEVLKCKHEFCKACIQEAMKYKPVCPVCNTFYGLLKGNQPDGTMTFLNMNYSLPGYPHCGTIKIDYNMRGGIQTKSHPNPGRPYYATSRTAYLPDNKEGREILKLLKRAFDQRLIFTVGQSRTSGATDVITWNDIHHKTSIHGGPETFGFPDPKYLKRVREELKAKGIE